MQKENKAISRRTFLQAGAAVSAATLITQAPRALAAGSDTIRVAMVGCGDRGTGAIQDCLKSSPGVELVALADVFQDKLDNCLAKVKAAFPDKVKTTPETLFLGFDACEKVLALPEVDIVLLCTPPGFRPQMVRAALEANKHIFMEKPGAVDPVGVRSLLKSAELADSKGLSIVVGTQQRWQPQYREIMRRVHDGQIGEIVGGQAYWNWGSSKWHWQPHKAHWSDMEWQIRCWPVFAWLSGDHIVEQHFHNMDVINWAMGSTPVSCIGMGGRQARVGPEFGNIYDHFTVEYEYPGGVRVMSMCSQIEGSTSRIGERVVGSKGSTYTTRALGYIEGQNPYEHKDKIYSGMVAEHAGLIKSIRSGKPLNECKRVAETSLTLIMGRMSAYTGRALKYSWALNQSKLDLSWDKCEMGDLPVRPVAIPGKTKLI